MTLTAGNQGERLQEAARAAITAMSYPGRVVKAPDLTAQGVFSAFAPVGRRAHVASGLGFVLPGGLIAAGMPQAEVLLVSGEGAADALGQAPRGDLSHPEDGATVVICVDRIGADGCEPQHHAGLSLQVQAGLAAPRSFTVLGLPAGAVARRAEACTAFPLGIDMLLVSDGAVVGVPRHAALTVKEG